MRLSPPILIALALGAASSACRTGAGSTTLGEANDRPPARLFQCLNSLSAVSEGRASPLDWEDAAGKPYRFAVIIGRAQDKPAVYLADEAGASFRVQWAAATPYRCAAEEASDPSFLCLSLPLPVPAKPTVALGLAALDEDAKVVEFAEVTNANRAEFASYAPATLVPEASGGRLLRDDIRDRLRMIDETAASYRRRFANDEAKSVEESARAARLACEAALND